MNKRLASVIARATLVAGLLAMLISGCKQKESADTDYDALAQKLVAQCTNVQEGDLVLITGGVRDVELLENLAVQVRKMGAFPLVSLGSERIARCYYDEVPAKYDSQTPGFDLALANLVTAVISVDYLETIGLLADVPAERIAMVSKAGTPVSVRMIDRNVRQVNLGNGLYPTADLANQFGVSKEELSSIFWDGVNTDYSQLQAQGETMKAALVSGSEVHITNPNGTDLRLRIDGRPVFVSDGVISDEEMELGGAACQVWHPAGEVYTTPVPGTAEGTVVVDHHFYQGQEIRNLTLTFEAGKLVSMTAESGLERLQALYDAAGPGKDLFAVVDVGLNPNVRIPSGSQMVAWMPAGMVTIGLGSNTWAGGGNSANFALYGHLLGSTLEVDGKIVVENGKLKL